MSEENQKTERQEQANKAKAVTDKAKDLPKEHGGRGGLEPVRYGDWEKDGKCVDF
jgi:hypothetical protein